MPRPRLPGPAFRYFNSSPEVIRLVVIKFMKKALKRHGSPEAITTDGLRSYKAAMTELQCRKAGGGTLGQQPGRELASEFSKTRASDAEVQAMSCLQKFASVHANVHNHFNTERHLIDRSTFKTRRSAALAEWQSLFS